MVRIFLIALLLPIFAFSQERQNSVLPKIIDTLTTLKSATGWVKNDAGKWVSRDNAIPSAISGNPYTCNQFIEYLLLKLYYENEYYICLIQKRDFGVAFWLLSYVENANKNLVDTNINLVSQLINKDIIYRTVKSKNDFLEELYKSFQKINSSEDYGELTINLLINKPKKYLRFYISDNSPLVSCGLSENAFEKRYFETSLTNFIFFLPLMSLSNGFKIDNISAFKEKKTTQKSTTLNSPITLERFKTFLKDFSDKYNSGKKISLNDIAYNNKLVIEEQNDDGSDFKSHKVDNISFDNRFKEEIINDFQFILNESYFQDWKLTNETNGTSIVIRANLETFDFIVTQMNNKIVIKKITRLYEP